MKLWVKLLLWVLGIVVLVFISLILYAMFAPIQNQIGSVSGVRTLEPNLSSPNKNLIKTQLDDVNKKISELPELEEDVFTKCMVGKKGTPQDIKTCQENTQTQIFTLSQDLYNLKKLLEAQ